MATTTIHIQGVPFEMPGATTVRYAAKRVAEGFGYDPEDPTMEYKLLLVQSGDPLDPGDVIADYDQCYLALVGVRR